MPQMSEQHASGEIRRVRNNEYLTTTDGIQFKRRVQPDGTRTEWAPVSPELPPKEDPLLLLMLVLENQAEGEPNHWCLFVAPEGKPGTVYQVTGDATFMRYEVQRDASPFGSESYHTSYVLAQLKEGQNDVVRECTEAEKPPCAESRADVRENCQGWTIRVLRRLRGVGIVSEAWVKFAEGVKEPV